VLAATAAALAACQPAAPPAPFKSIGITGATYARDFRLPDPEGAMRSLGEFKGKVVLVFFGFAQRPDACPTALGRAIAVRKQLGPAGDKVQVVLITVDPERDTPEGLREYMKAYDPSFMRIDSGIMRMRPVIERPIKAGQSIELKSGGYHPMMMDLNRQLEAGDTVALTLEFNATDGSVSKVEVEAVAAITRPAP
jgi:protein SCO1/2